MEITNKTSFLVIAVCWHTERGHGEEVAIQPDETREVLGPYLGEMDGGSCHIATPHEITCHEGEDGKEGYHVSKGNQLVLSSGKNGVTVRHHSEDIKFQE